MKCPNCNSTFLNIGLLRLCSIIFITNGLLVFYGAFQANMIDFDFKIRAISFLIPLFTIFTGSFSIIKNNSTILKVYSFLFLVFYLISNISTIYTLSQQDLFSFLLIPQFFLNVYPITCVATFFIEPEKNSFIMKKLKIIFYKWKNLT